MRECTHPGAAKNNYCWAKIIRNSPPASELRRAGVAESTIMDIGGWKNSSVLRRYAIKDPRDIAAAIQKRATRLGPKPKAMIPILRLPPTMSVQLDASTSWHAAFELSGARRRNRTVTSCYGPGILSPVRLPVSPSGRAAGEKSVSVRRLRLIGYRACKRMVA